MDIGLMGVPVFAQGGRIDYIFRSTFGYHIGFIIAAYVIGKIKENIKELTFIKTVFMMLSGLFFIYLFGVSYLYTSYNFYSGKNISFYLAFFMALLYVLLEIWYYQRLQPIVHWKYYPY